MKVLDTDEKMQAALSQYDITCTKNHDVLSIIAEDPSGAADWEQVEDSVVKSFDWYRKKSAMASAVIRAGLKAQKDTVKEMWALCDLQASLQCDDLITLVVSDVRISGNRSSISCSFLQLPLPCVVDVSH